MFLIKGRTTGEAFEDQGFLWERRASVADFDLPRLINFQGLQHAKEH